jgi:hypothetical protein
MGSGNSRVHTARLVVGYATVVVALPYLSLKIVWLAGGTLGVADRAMMHDASMIALNAITAGMDLVAIAIALAFTHSWGLKLPAWLVLPPIWVATGLLVQFVTGVPVALIASLLSGINSAPTTSGPVHVWVYALVYPAFAGLGIGLTLSFALYSRVRWGQTLQSEFRNEMSGAAQIVHVPLANAAVVMAAAVAALHLTWACGGTVGMPDELVARRTVSARLLEGINAVTMLSAPAGILLMRHRVREGRRFWVPLSFAWVGSGYLFAWGLWHLVNVLGYTALVRARPVQMPLINLASLVQLIAGLVIGVVMLLQLAERQPAR